MNSIKFFINRNLTEIILITAFAVSIFSFVYFFTEGELNLAYGDAVSRLNITRKMVDNLTPGFGQIGSIWLPLPFLLMLPFIGNSFLWHSGIAGYIVSGASFILSVFYLYKLGRVAFESKFSGVIMSLFGLTAINYMYIQTTAMSESLFIFTIIAATYHLYKWAKKDIESDLFVGAIFVSAASFIRYEGYFIFLFSVLMVGIITYIKTRSKRQLEGNLIIFTTLAMTGILAWIVYNWAIFGNPFYWLDIYTGDTSIISTDAPVETLEVTAQAAKAKINILEAFYKYWSSTVQTNGIYIAVLASIAAIIFPIVKLIKGKLSHQIHNLALYLPFGVFAFTVGVIYGGFPVEQPSLSITNLMNRDTSLLGEYNIRYGLNMLPMVAIFIGWLASLKYPIKILVSLVLLVQVITTFWFPVYSVYQIPQNFVGKASSHHKGINPASNWLKAHYDGGLIMISAQTHNPDMFYLGYDYKTFIHEGTGKYWLTSRENPQRYAKWIFMYSLGKSKDDSVTKYISNNPNLQFYDLVYQDGTYEIYKIKTAPEIEIKK